MTHYILVKNDMAIVLLTLYCEL